MRRRGAAALARGRCGVCGRAAMMARGVCGWACDGSRGRGQGRVATRGAVQRLAGHGQGRATTHGAVAEGDGSRWQVGPATGR
ncbi:hypothetical protein GUJ93_ZPchr0002g26484 [Zizania palustris]|uniref:Uncharacterized protein n=1 Tax=Zizania palustris TaxID=103762 RepID=A0A8J5SB74_ZIZPA|nr:hypothetical protein GUJ93_ZPchr0002g26484 [Zizania palustris]